MLKPAQEKHPMPKLTLLNFVILGSKSFVNSRMSLYRRYIVKKAEIKLQNRLPTSVTEKFAKLPKKFRKYLSI